MRKQKTKRKRSMAALAILAAGRSSHYHVSPNVLAEAAQTYKYRCRGKVNSGLVTTNGFTVLNRDMAYRMLDNPPEPNESLLALLALR